MTYSHIVNAFSLDSLFLSLKISSQNLCIVKPSVAILIFLSNNDKPILSVFLHADTCVADGINISAIDLFECRAI